MTDTASDAEFASRALQAFRRQCERIPAYGAFARHLGRGPDQVLDWRDIPPVPVSAFRSHDLSAAPPGKESVVFETSGTTISLPGRIRLGDTGPYEQSLMRSFSRYLLPDKARLPAIVFGPSRDEAPRSSLWFMADAVVHMLCEGATHIVTGGEPQWERADEALAGKSPMLLIGTTLLHLAYFDRCDSKGRRHALPEGSRAMDTGGAKASGREIKREEVHAAFERVLGIPPTHVVNEYGMTELGSQFYEDSLLAHHERRAPRAGLMIPPWVRTRAFDPHTGRECPPGGTGYLVHYDLANVEVPLAIQTEDVGSVDGPTLHLQGRLPEAERRGCSLPFERFLEMERRR